MSSALSELCSKLCANLAEAQLLSAICCPESGLGLVAALTRTETALTAYFEHSELPRVETWLKVCRALADKCEDMHEAGFVDLGLPAPDKCSSVFADLASKSAHRPTDAAAVKADQLLGVVLAGAISSNTPPAVLALEAWSTLRRAGRGRKGAHANWGKLIEAVPVTSDEIKAALAWVTATGLRELLEEALHYSSTAVDATPPRRGRAEVVQTLSCVALGSRWGGENVKFQGRRAGPPLQRTLDDRSGQPPTFARQTRMAGTSLELPHSGMRFAAPVNFSRMD